MGTWGLLFVTISSAPPITENFQTERRESILTVEITSLRIRSGDMEDALRRLRQADPSRILIGFEKIPHREGERDESISLELTNTTVGDCLDRLCEVDPRYTYEVVGGALINVFPWGAKSDANDLLNIKVASFEFYGNELPHNLIIKIGDLAPELREYLRLKAEAYAKKTGKPLGSAGSILSGNAPLPRISLKLQNVTVREILNAVVLYSVKLSHEGQLYGWPPISWKYEFIIDPNAPTGLGGYPRWSTF